MSVRMERVSYNGWRDAYRLTNGVVEVVVVPEVARVMRYGFVGGPNCLWENPTMAGKPIPLGQWPAGGGTGGDKVWPWPQDDWPLHNGVGWPPPPGADQAPFQAQVVAPDTLRLISPPIIGWGLHIERDIRLEPTGTTVRVRNRFVAATGGPLPVSVWEIAQVPVADNLVWAHRLSEAAGLPNGYKPLGDGGKFAAIDPQNSPEGPMLRLRRNPSVSAKVGMEADSLAVRFSEGTLLTIGFDPVAAPENGTYHPGERAQVYAQADNDGDRAKGIAPYFELELTSPLRVLGPGETLTLSVTWKLNRL